MNVSYDYEDMIQELHEDVTLGILKYDSYIWIVRADKPVFKDYKPIIDWYYLEDLKDKALDEMDKVKAKKRQLGAVLVEMVEANDIFKGI